MCAATWFFKASPPCGCFTAGAHASLEPLIRTISVQPTCALYTTSCCTLRVQRATQANCPQFFLYANIHQEQSEAERKEGRQWNTHRGTHLEEPQLLHRMRDLIFFFAWCVTLQDEIQTSDRLCHSCIRTLGIPKCFYDLWLPGWDTHSASSQHVTLCEPL